MANEIRKTLDWWQQFNKSDLLITATNRKFFLQINFWALPHLLGLNYSYKNSRAVTGGRILKQLAKKSDEEIYALIELHNPKMPASVKSRVKSFKTFMETLELASLVENTKN